MNTTKKENNCSQIKDIKSFDDLKGLNAIPADTKFVVQTDEKSVEWSNSIDPALTKGYDYSAWYMSSDKGDLYSIDTHDLMSNSKNRKDGYIYFNFYRKNLNNGKIVRVAASRVTARVHTPDEELPDNWQELDVGHIDSDITNNSIENLKFQTHVENCNEPHHRAALSAANRGRTRTPEQWKRQSEAQKGIGVKAVVQLDCDGSEVSHFLSIIEAAQETGIDPGNISAVCNNRRHTAGGYRWEFA